MLSPSPGRLLLRPVQTDDTLAGGRIQLLDSTREAMTPNQYHVVRVGGPLPCEEPDCERPHHDRCHPIPCTEGDWILVRHRSVVPTDEPPLVIAFHDDVLAVLTVAAQTTAASRPRSRRSLAGTGSR